MNIVLVGSLKIDEYKKNYPTDKIWIFEENKTKFNKLSKKLPNKVFLDNYCISDYNRQNKNVLITTLHNLFIDIDFLVIDDSPYEVLNGLKKIRPRWIDCEQCDWLEKNKYKLVDNIYESES